MNMALAWIKTTRRRGVASQGRRARASSGSQGGVKSSPGRGDKKEFISNYSKLYFGVNKINRLRLENSNGKLDYAAQARIMAFQLAITPA